MTKQLRWLVAFLAVAILGTASWLIFQLRTNSTGISSVGITQARPTPTPIPTKTPSPTPTPTSPPATTPTPKPTKAPATTTGVPFYSQAPLGNWDADHEDACEEASMFMVHYWLNKERPSLNAYDVELLKLIRWQDEHHYGISEGVEEMKQIMHDYFSTEVTIQTIDSADQLRGIVEGGTVVIMPADGRLLHNPHFRGSGPPYHVLVLKGYADGHFISNDPGTRYGENYTYHPDVIMDALGNWNGSRVDRNDRRVLLIGA